MRSMIYYELKKILGRKLNVVAILASYVLILVCVYVFVFRTAFYDGTTDSYIKGIKAYRMIEASNEQMTDYLTEEYLTGLVESVHAQGVDTGTDDGYIQVIRPKRDVFRLLCINYMKVDEYVDWGKLNEISTDGGIHFYERRIEKAREYLDQDFSYGNYSEAEKEFWLDREANVQTPFQWGDVSVMEIVWDTILLSFGYMFFVIAVCISPVFASEHESGASALLLTVKYGKTKLICAKILASVLFVFLCIAIELLLGLGFIGITVGFHGAELPVQLLGDTIIPYNWTVGKAFVITFAMLMLVALALALFTMLLSSRLKGSLSTLVVVFIILIGPAYLPMSRESGLWNHINYLFPIRVVNVSNVIGTLNSYQFGPVVLSYVGMAVVVYLAVAAVSLCGIRNGFAKHQVNS